MSQPTERQLIESWAHDACMDPFCQGGCPERFPAERTILEIKAAAWDEGWLERANYTSTSTNPYRSKE